MPEGGTPTTPETLEDALKAIEDLTAKLTDATKHSRDWEERAKANKDAAPLLEKATARIKELETAQDSGKSDLEKQVAQLTDDLSALTKRAEDAEANASTERLAALRTRIGTAKDVPAHLIDRLKGEDEESITADADAIVAGLPQQPKKPGVPGQGKQGEAIEEDKLLGAFAGGLGLPDPPKE